MSLFIFKHSDGKHTFYTEREVEQRLTDENASQFYKVTNDPPNVDMAEEHLDLVPDGTVFHEDQTVTVQWTVLTIPERLKDARLNTHNYQVYRQLGEYYNEQAGLFQFDYQGETYIPLMDFRQLLLTELLAIRLNGCIVGHSCLRISALKCQRKPISEDLEVVSSSTKSEDMTQIPVWLEITNSSDIADIFRQYLSYQLKLETDLGHLQAKYTRNTYRALIEWPGTTTLEEALKQRSAT